MSRIGLKSISIILSVCLLLLVGCVERSEITKAPESQIENKETELDTTSKTCSFEGTKCLDTKVYRCKNGKLSLVKVCPSLCERGHCVYKEGETLVLDNTLYVTLVFAKPVTLYEYTPFEGKKPVKMFKVRFKVENKGNKEESFLDPEMNTVLIDDLGNQYEPEVFLMAEDPDQKSFGSSSIFPGVKKYGDVYFETIDPKAKKIRVILKEDVFGTYTEEEIKGFMESDAFEWVVDLESKK